MSRVAGRKKSTVSRENNLSGKEEFEKVRVTGKTQTCGRKSICCKEVLWIRIRKDPYFSLPDWF
jgi:hypothetical protein